MSKLTRKVRLTKLRSAIKDYRRRHKTPDKKAKTRVVKWLESLGIRADITMPVIDGFQTTQDMQVWLDTID